MSKHGVRFAAGTMVGPGEYRNTKTGTTRYFDGQTPLPGGVNAPSWEQVSDHYHAEMQTPPQVHHEPPPAHPVRFAPGTMVSAGEYRNTVTGEHRFFDGNTPLPGPVNGPAWQQVSDHQHVEMRR
jgi:hypothetical protein